MFPWFHLLVVGIIWKAFEDFWMEQIGDAEDAISKKLRELKAGEQLATSPLVKVLAVDNAADTVTILVRGPIQLSDAVTPFMRVEVVISRGDIHLTGDGPPIRVKEWRTVIGDLAINRDKGSGEKQLSSGSTKVVEGSLGFGYADGAWMGEGSMKVGVAPARLGAAIYGGISDRGMVLGLDAEFPAGGAIPLGPTGLGLRGFGGDFAYNFVARLEKAGIPIVTPTAFDYVTWARDRQSIDRWKPGPTDKTAVGIGVRTVLCTIADQGFIFELNPIGFAFLTPGGAFMLGGKGMLLRQKGFGIESYFVVDFASASLAFGAGVNIEIKSPPEEIVGFPITTLKGSALLDVFFSFSDPTAWFFDVGREDKPALLEVLVDVPVISMLFGEKTEAYLRINHHRIAFGASFSLGGTFKLKKILEATLRKGASLHGYMGRDPLLIRGKLDVMGELGLKAFEKFEFKLTGHVTVVVHLPTPVLFRIALPYKLDLPWPLPDIEDSILELGDDEIVAPAISSPLLTGSFTVGGSPTIQDQKIAAITASHTVSERHWMPGVDKLWPDLELVVPFSRQVTDTTSSVVGLVVTASIVSIPGSYDVKEELTKLEILDLVHNTVVPDVKAVWVDGPDGNTSLLHVLGSDPFSWLTPQTSTANLGSSTPAKIRDVFFGFGPPETFGLPRRFDDMFVTPLTDPAKLVTEFQLHLVTRVLRTKEVKMSFMSGGDEIAVDQVTLLLIGFNKRDKLVIGPGNVEVSLTDGDPIVGGAHFVIATFTFPTPRTHFTVRTQHGEEFLVYSVRYREAARKADVTWKKTLLKPGRYRLTVEGKSTAEHPEFNNVHPEIYPSAPPIDWWATQDFEVVYPETLHPYIFYSTFGDNRRFSRDQHPWTTWTADTWDPALFGFGLPLYRQYHLVVRFLVPYVGAMFGDAPLKVRIVYDKGGEIVYTVVATPAPDGSSSMLPESTTWITAMGGMVPADQELVVPQLLPAPSDPAGAGGLNPGSARLTISFNHPGGGDVPVEDWTGLVSRFNNFREHLAWNGTCLTTFYDKYGRHQRPACPALSWPAEKSGLDLFFAGGIEPLVVAGTLSKPPKPTSAVGALLVEPTETGPMIAYPPELTSAPLDWILPPALFEQLGGLDNSAGLRFGRFAAATGVRFNAGSGDALSGMSDTVGATTIEAVIDSLGRPYALWVRTPEPVDWRRVTATLSIRHVEPEKKVPQFVQPGKPGDDCPTSYVHRSPLELAVSVLPSPDGSSVFLVGDFAGSKIVLPRGEFTLMLKFDPAKAGLPPLRPSTLVGPGSEMVTLRFLQPLGKTWPLASDDLVIPNYVVQTAMRYLKFPPELLIEAYQKQLSAEEFERRIRAHLQSIDAAVTAPDAEALETLESHKPQRGKA